MLTLSGVAWTIAPCARCTDSLPLDTDETPWAQLCSLAAGGDTRRATMRWWRSLAMLKHACSTTKNEQSHRRTRPLIPRGLCTRMVTVSTLYPEWLRGG